MNASLGEDVTSLDENCKLKKARIEDVPLPVPESVHEPEPEVHRSPTLMNGDKKEGGKVLGLAGESWCIDLLGEIGGTE